MENLYKYYFTIFIPTFNRGHLLGRVFESIAQQTFRDFEVLVVDDGSTDNTTEIVKDWSSRAFFPVVYHKKENGGKISAHNFALDKLQGFFTVTLDSDDMLTPMALEIFKKHWEEIPEHKRENFAGVEGLCFLQTGKVQGGTYPEDLMDTNYLEVQYLYRVRGDKKNAIRTRLLREYPYPQFPGEKNMPPSVIWTRMAKRYQFRCFNEPVQIVEQLPDGLTARRFVRQMQSPNGFRLMARELLDADFPYCFRDLLRFSIRYVRFSLHAGIPLHRQLRETRRKVFWFLALPEGSWRWLRDNFRFYLGKRKPA